MLFADIKSSYQAVIDTINSSPVLKVVIILTAMFIAQRIIDVLTNRYFERAYEAQLKKNKIKISKKRFETLSQAFRKIASVAIWLVGSFFIFTALFPGVDLAAVMAGAGAIGIVIGLAGKDIIMDLYVGLMALIEDQYRVGDVITIDPDHSGVVEEITLRTVKLRDVDGSVHIVPHSMARAIINQTYGYSMVNVELGVPFDSDIEKIIKVVNETGTKLSEDEEWKKQIIDPIQYQTMLRFDESQLTFRAQGKVKPGKQWAIASEFRVRIKEAFDRNSIDIPLPQRVVRTINEDAKKSSKK